MIAKTFIDLSHDEMRQLVSKRRYSLTPEESASIAKVSTSGEWFDGQHGCLLGTVVIHYGGSFSEVDGKYIPANAKTKAMCERAIQFLEAGQKLQHSKFIADCITVKKMRLHK